LVEDCQQQRLTLTSEPCSRSPESAFTIDRIGRSGSTGIDVHDPPESAFTIRRNAQQKRLDLLPDAMGTRRQTVEHVFGTLKSWMGSAHFLTKTLKNVRTEMSLSVLAYNMKRMIRIMGRSGAKCVVL
jgi:hypothetical protein